MYSNCTSYRGNARCLTHASRRTDGIEDFYGTIKEIMLHGGILVVERNIANNAMESLPTLKWMEKWMTNQMKHEV